MAKEKAIVNKVPTKKGFTRNISFVETGKKMPLSIPVPDEMYGQEVEVERENGQPVAIYWNGRIFRKEDVIPPKKATTNQAKKNTKNLTPARAPYNFVPLNEKVVASNGKTDHSLYEGLSGYIDINLKTLLPLFIRGGDTLFFNKNGKFCIPGSSFRGMIAHLVHIVSYGKLNQFDNKVLYRRSNLTDDGKDIEAGFLFFSNNKFTIKTAGKIEQRSDDALSKNPFQYKYGSNYCKFSVGSFQDKCRVWQFTFDPKGRNLDVDPQIIESYESDKSRADDCVNLIKSLKARKIVNNTDDSIGNCQVPAAIGIPVFYRVRENNVISIGHAKYHRVPYSKSIGDHVRQENIEGCDFNETMFGTTNHATKLFFEDLEIRGDISFELNDPKRPKILSSPKPTSYQHYLEQPNGINTSQTNQEKWSGDASIRGVKNYWHRKTSSKESDANTWIETGNISNSHSDPINPVKSGNQFSGRIRFENLTREELGALLFVLDLPEGCAHKLGLGKPLGLGSVRIAPKLTIIDRDKRYKALFNTDGEWETGVRFEEDLKTYKDCFAQFMGKKLNASNITDHESYWQKNDRMKTLKTMLTFEHDMRGASVDWIERTRYMGLEEFKKRPVLPTPTEVIDTDTYKK